MAPMLEGIAFHTQQVRVEPDLAKSQMPEPIKAPGRENRSAVAVPLVVAGEPVGVLSVVSNREGRFGLSGRQYIQSIATALAHALQAAADDTR
jgi:GAF domain-containing protein